LRTAVAAGGYWFKPDAPWRKLVTAWAAENRWRPEDLQLSSVTLNGLERGRDDAEMGDI